MSRARSRRASSPGCTTTTMGKCRVRSSERTWLHSRRPSAPARLRLTISRSYWASPRRTQRRRQIGLDIDLMQFAEHGHDQPGHALVVLDQQDAPPALGLRPRQAGARQGADLGAGRHAQHHLVVQRLEARQVLDAGDERDVVDRLGDEIVGAGFQPLHLVGGLIERRHHDDRHVRRLGRGLDAAADLEAVHARHHDVEQHHVDALGPQDGQRLLAGKCRQHLEVFGGEPGIQQFDIGQDVVNDQNAASHQAPSKPHEPGGSHASPRYRRTVSRNVPIEIGLEM